MWQIIKIFEAGWKVDKQWDIYVLILRFPSLLKIGAADIDVLLWVKQAEWMKGRKYWLGKERKAKKGKDKFVELSRKRWGEGIKEGNGYYDVRMAPCKRVYCSGKSEWLRDCDVYSSCRVNIVLHWGKTNSKGNKDVAFSNCWWLQSSYEKGNTHKTVNEYWFRRRGYNYLMATN